MMYSEKKNKLFILVGQCLLITIDMVNSGKIKIVVLQVKIFAVNMVNVQILAPD